MSALPDPTTSTRRVRQEDVPPNSPSSRTTRKVLPCLFRAKRQSNPRKTKYDKLLWLQYFLRIHGLSLVWYGTRRLFNLPADEVPKRALHKNRMLAVLSLTTHFLPISACLVIFVLNFQGYYIGGELAGSVGQDELKLSVLQFVAKFHELLMQASLSLVVVSIVRQEIFSARSIPFGAIFGSVQFSNITYLWSRQFMGTIRSSVPQRWRKWNLIFVILVGSLLFNTVGPSSAIAMRPRLDVFPVGGTRLYLNATRDQLWPSHLDITEAEPDFAKDWPVVADDFFPLWGQLRKNMPMPESFTVPSPKSMRRINTRQKFGLYWRRWTLTTTPMSNMADVVTEVGRYWINAAVGHNVIGNLPYSPRFRWRHNVMWTMDDIYQPLVMSGCHIQENITMEMVRNGGIAVPMMESKCESNTTGLLAKLHNTTMITDLLSHYNDTSSTEAILRFVELPFQNFTKNTIGAFLALPPSWPAGNALVSCAVDARWAPSIIEGRRNVIKEVNSNAMTGQSWIDAGTCYTANTKRLTVSSRWANALNPMVPYGNKTVIDSILSQVPQSVYINGMENKLFMEATFESILSILLSNGLANTGSSAIPQGMLKGCTVGSCKETCEDNNGEWCKEIMPEGKRIFGPGRDIYALPPGIDMSGLSEFRANVTIDGYGFDMRPTSLRLACSVLLAYCFFALVHVYMALDTGLSSQAWDTASEIVALALQSRPTTVLKNTSAGISTVNIFKLAVKIGQLGSESEHLELLFDKDSHGGNISPPEPGKLYQ